MNKSVILTLLTGMTFVIGLPLYGGPDSVDNFYSILVPGQNGGGGWSFQANNIINTKQASNYGTIGENGGFDLLKIDLGQANCIKHFDTKFKNDSLAQNPNTQLLLYGISQGTSTLPNWIASQPKHIQDKIKCLVLEAVLGNGNNAIRHTTQELIVPKWVTYIPFYRYWLPWLAKFNFPTYNPLGNQALDSAKKLPTNLPVIIMHHENDFQLPVNDAREFYCTLRESGNDNAYLFEVNNKQRTHFEVLETEELSLKKKKIAAMQAIYKKHNLPHNEELIKHNSAAENVGLIKEFQPNVQDIRKKITDSSKAENKGRNIIDCTTTGALLGLVIGYLANR